MKTRRRARVASGLSAGLLVAGLGLTACTSSPEPSPSPSLDSESTSPPDPFLRAIEVAFLDGHRYEIEEAVSGFEGVLSGSNKGYVRQLAMANLIDLGEAIAQDSGATDRLGGDCAKDESALSAFQVVLDSPDRPVHVGGDFYEDAARLKGSVIECEHNSLQIDATEAINALVEAEGEYPQSQAIAENLAAPIFGIFDDMLINAQSLSEPYALAGSIWGAFGDDVPMLDGALNGPMMDLLALELCDGYDSAFSTAGIATTAKIINCPSAQVQVDLGQTGLLATTPSESYFLLEYGQSYIGDSVYLCEAYDVDTLSPFTYTKEGRFADIFSLIDTRTGGVAYTKTFNSTTPRCCESGTYSGGVVYDCEGGQDPYSTYDPSTLIAWLQGRAG